VIGKIIKKTIEDKVEERIKEAEHEFEKDLLERAGKVIVVGLATVIFSMIVESQYDKFMERRRERDENV
jgi:hypothetical protein